MWTALSVVNSLASLLGLGWAQEVLSQCAEGHTHPHPERNSLLAPRAVFSIPTALGARSKPKLRQPWHREVAWGEEHGLGNKLRSGPGTWLREKYTSSVPGTHLPSAEPSSSTLTALGST